MTTFGPDEALADGDRIDDFFERLIARASTVDEHLSDNFEPLRGQKRDTDVAAQRLAAWCRSCASGDWLLFGRRLARDGLTFDQVLARFAAARHSAMAARPSWIEDAVWIEQALRSTAVPNIRPDVGDAEPHAFEHLLWPLVQRADALLTAVVDPRALGRLTEAARRCLVRMLLKELTSLCAPGFYELFAQARKKGRQLSEGAERQNAASTSCYDQFVADMKAGGFRRLFEKKPVLLRLVAVVTRQWIDIASEFITRLDADLAIITRTILQSGDAGMVAMIEGERSDRHNNGRSVLIISFEDGSRVVYKPKNLQIDAAWHALIERLNGTARVPIALKAARAVARDGYGWTEFVDHTGCADQESFRRFFRRAGAWLAVFHCFAATDMHQENIIATGDHPVPIDLEMILQGKEQAAVQNPEEQATSAAREMLSQSVMMVGLLPAYARSPNNAVFAMGGMTSRWDVKAKINWYDINSDAMRPAIVKETGKSNPNLPHVGGRYARFADYIEDFISGFADYAKFLFGLNREEDRGKLFDGFVGLSVRKVIRPTRFYHMLLQRLKDHRTMDDGIVWSAQADFLSRLANWEIDGDPLWVFQRSERDALLTLNVPHFVTTDDGEELFQTSDCSIDTKPISGLSIARARLDHLDDREIAWQIEVIRQNTGTASKSAKATPVRQQQSAPLRLDSAQPSKEVFIAEADRIAEELSRYAMRRGPGAAWIGLDWLGDAEVFQLVCLDQSLYNGNSGIAVFLAAHAAKRSNSSSAELALAAVALLRKNLRSRNAARITRSMGVGGAVGLGSAVYALCVMSRCLKDDDLLADALKAADLFTDELIAADKQLDVIGGSAGGILSLLRLYRDTQSEDVLKRAIKCGEHLMSQPRLGPEGQRSWVGQGFGSQALNGMSHGAAGFAYALASLAAASGRAEFEQAAEECIAFEDSSYDPVRKNWPDLRNPAGPAWSCRWCHGAPGIGLARLATGRSTQIDTKLLDVDIRNAVEGVQQCSPAELDTLCCGTLGSIEFFCEAGRSLDRSDLCDMAGKRLTAVLEQAAVTGDYRWNSGKRQFNLGLFRGLSGVGYTVLRQIDRSLPNVLIWE
jgi:type 2 lantibiotic biosynthesis protein LanM